MTIKTYAIVDSSGNVINVTLWDGNTEEWTPPDGTTAVQIDNAAIGGTYIGGVYSAPVPPPPPTPTAAQLAARALAGGIAITSTGHASLNGTYSTTTESIANVANVTTYILRNSRFPGGVTSMPWIDKSGTPHVFPDTATFENFATAFADFVAACQIYGDSNGAIGAIPSNAITIP